MKNNSFAIADSYVPLFGLPNVILDVAWNTLGGRVVGAPKWRRLRRWRKWKRKRRMMMRMMRPMMRTQMMQVPEKRMMAPTVLKLLISGIWNIDWRTLVAVRTIFAIFVRLAGCGVLSCFIVVSGQPLLPRKALCAKDRCLAIKDLHWVFRQESWMIWTSSSEGYKPDQQQLDCFLLRRNVMAGENCLVSRATG